MTDLHRPKGTTDILPPESNRWRNAHRVFDDLAERFGFDLVLTPIIEHTDVFSRGVGQDTEVVEKQMYTFSDQSGRSLTLRPEATASVVRAAIQAGGTSNFKAAYWGPMFRYERPQQGRKRQFYQGGIEYLGSASPDADVEVIEFGYRYLQAMGVPKIDVYLNSIGDPADRTTYREQITTFLRSKENQLSDDAVRRIDTNPMRVLDSKADAEVVKDAPVPIDHLGIEASNHFEAVKSGLQAVGVPFTIDDKLVRGLDYYNRTVFEYVPAGYGSAQNAVGGGGRYDGLFEMLGGKPNPAVGLSMGIDRILQAGESGPDAPSLDLFIVVVHESLRQDATVLVSTLRQAGLRADMADEHRSVTAQFKEANRRGSVGAVVVGDEWSDGEVTVRDLVSGSQQVIDTKEIAGWIEAL